MLVLRWRSRAPLTVDFRNFNVFVWPRPWHIEIRHRVKKHLQSICSDLRLSNRKFEDSNYGNRPHAARRRGLARVAQDDFDVGAAAAKNNNNNNNSNNTTTTTNNNNNKCPGPSRGGAAGVGVWPTTRAN